MSKLKSKLLVTDDASLSSNHQVADKITLSIKTSTFSIQPSIKQINLHKPIPLHVQNKSLQLVKASKSRVGPFVPSYSSTEQQQQQVTRRQITSSNDEIVETIPVDSLLFNSSSFKNQEDHSRRTIITPSVRISRSGRRNLLKPQELELIPEPKSSKPPIGSIASAYDLDYIGIEVWDRPKPKPKDNPIERTLKFLNRFHLGMGTQITSSPVNPSMSKLHKLISPKASNQNEMKSFVDPISPSHKTLPPPTITNINPIPVATIIHQLQSIPTSSSNSPSKLSRQYSRVSNMSRRSSFNDISVASETDTLDSSSNEEEEDWLTATLKQRLEPIIQSGRKPSFLELKKMSILTLNKSLSRKKSTKLLNSRTSTSSLSESQPEQLSQQLNGNIDHRSHDNSNQNQQTMESNILTNNSKELSPQSIKSTDHSIISVNSSSQVTMSVQISSPRVTKASVSTPVGAFKFDDAKLETIDGKVQSPRSQVSDTPTSLIKSLMAFSIPTSPSNTSHNIMDIEIDTTIDTKIDTKIERVPEIEMEINKGIDNSNNNSQSPQNTTVDDDSVVISTKSPHVVLTDRYDTADTSIVRGYSCQPLPRESSPKKPNSSSINRVLSSSKTFRKDIRPQSNIVKRKYPKKLPWDKLSIDSPAFPEEINNKMNLKDILASSDDILPMTPNFHDMNIRSNVTSLSATAMMINQGNGTESKKSIGDVTEELGKAILGPLKMIPISSTLEISSFQKQSNDKNKINKPNSQISTSKNRSNLSWTDRKILIQYSHNDASEYNSKLKQQKYLRSAFESMANKSKYYPQLNNSI